MSLPECTVNTANIQNLPDSPNMSASELKQKFDKAGKEIKNYINDLLIPAIEDLVKTEKNTLSNSLKQSTDKLNQELIKTQNSIGEKILEDNKKRYPVGRLFFSEVDVNPTTILGFGSWTKIQDRFILASGSTYKAKATGGEATHKLTVNELPSHNHSVNIKHNPWVQASTYGSINPQGSTGANGADVSAISIGNTGGNVAHNNMPPYYVVHVYRRTA